MIRRPLVAVAVVIALSAAAASTQAFADVADGATPAFSLLLWQTSAAEAVPASRAPQLVR